MVQQLNAALLFALGFFGVLLRKNTLVIYMCLELMLVASTLALVAFSRFNGTLDGHVFVFFILTVAAAEVAVGLALIVVYIVLGVLYEDFVHPLTILSSLPSAGVGALLTLMWFDLEFSVVAMIGVILLIGIVKKNAILMIDVALQTQRRGRTPAQAIFVSAQTRLRPILMTTAAAMLGAIPLALAQGVGAEMRQPLGLSVLGGLVLSQWLTLYTTPIVFVGLERLRSRWFGPRHMDTWMNEREPSEPAAHPVGGTHA